jgi:hypothetical protein
MASIASNGNNNISTENTPNELTSLQDQVVALTEKMKRRGQELQDLKSKIGNKQTPISTTNTKSINKIIRAILVPKKTHDNYKYVVDQICEFLKTTVKTKSKKFESVAEVFKGGSWKKDTDINLNKIKKLPNSDIDLVIMLNGQEKDRFDWVKDYADELKKLFISDYPQIELIRHKHEPGDGIITSKHAIKFDQKLPDIDSYVHIDLLISPKFTSEELRDKVEEFKEVPDKLKFLTKALAEKQTEKIKGLFNDSPEAKKAIRFLKFWKFFIWKRKKNKCNQPSSYFIECIIYKIHLENKQETSMYEYIQLFFKKVSSGRLRVTDVACEYNDVAKDLTDNDWEEIKVEGLKMKTDKGIAGFIDQVKESKLFSS